MGFPSPGDLPDPGIEPGSPAFQADALTSEPPGKPRSRRGGIKRGESKLASNHFLMCSPQSGSLLWASQVAQRLKHLPAMRETWVRSLGREDPLEKEMATHSSILAWRIPWTEESGGLQSTGLKD